MISRLKERLNIHLNRLSSVGAKTEWVLLFIITIGAATIFVIRIYHNSFFLNDSYEYLKASNELKLLVYGIPSDNAFYILKRLIIYPLFLSISSNTIFIAFLQMVFVIFTMLMIVYHLKRSGIKLDWRVFTVIICTPSIWLYCHLMMAEWLIFSLITTLFLIVSHKGFEKSNKIIQFIVVLLAFTKPVFYPFVFLNLGFYLVYSVFAKKIMLWAIIPVLLVLAYLSFNNNKYGVPLFSSIENTNLIHYNCFYFVSAHYGPKEADRWITEIEDKTKNLGFGEKIQLERSEAQKLILNNFWHYSIFHFVGSIRGMIDPGRFDLNTLIKMEVGNQGLLEILNGRKAWSSLYGSTSTMVLLLLIPIFIVNLIKWFYAAKYLIFTKFTIENLYIATLLLYLIFITGPINASRFMMPIQGVLIIWAMKGMKINISRNKSHRV